MIGIELVRSARADVAQLKPALTAVGAGLETVEAAAEAVDVARRGFRRVLVIGVVSLVVAVVAAAVRSWRGKESNRRRPSRRPSTGGPTPRNGRLPDP